MSATSATLRGRQKAEELMVDTCTITRTTNASANVETGRIVSDTVTIYSGKCRLKLPVAIARPEQAGEAQLFTQHPILSLPATTTGVQVDDVLTITASQLMPSLVGRKFHLRAVPGQSHMTAARFEIMEIMS